MRIAYDSTTAADTPPGADLYLGYTDGLYANVAALHSKHRGAKIVGITVTGRDLDAEMADVETGDLSPWSGAKWAADKHDRGQVGTLYFPASLYKQVVSACREHNLRPGKDVLFFAAQYDGSKEIPSWAVGKQYLHGDKNHPGSYSGGHYDVSVVRDYWPGVDPVRPTDLSKRSTFLTTHLTKRLSRRKKAVGKGKPLLVALRNQINRVLELKG